MKEHIGCIKGPVKGRRRQGGREGRGHAWSTCYSVSCKRMRWWISMGVPVQVRGWRRKQGEGARGGAGKGKQRGGR